MRNLISIFAILVATGPISATAQTAFVTVPTKAPHNAEARVWYHVPANYDPATNRLWRVLVYFGGRNCSGEREANGLLGWSDWADRRGVFLVCPGFKDDNYWEPQAWSGKALLQALAENRKTYRIDSEHLLFYGYSAGSQASNLFPAWRPALCRGWVSHACGVFHDPGAGMRGVPGLVTCGDVDAARFVISRAFVRKALKRGVNVIWKSLPNHPHDVPPDSLALARAFFEWCDDRFADDLAPPGLPKKSRPEPPAPYVGDDADGVYWPRTSPKARRIQPEDRVFLPTKAVADAWGKPGEEPAPPATR